MYNNDTSGIEERDGKKRVSHGCTCVAGTRSGTRKRKRETTHVKSAAKPAPTPDPFVGVLTDTKMRSASTIALSTSVEKNRFLPRLSKTISSRPGS